MIKSRDIGKLIYDLAASYGMHIDSSWIMVAQELARRSSNNYSLLESFLEFSFVAGEKARSPLRYVINVSDWKKRDAKRLLLKGLKFINVLPLQEPKRSDGCMLNKNWAEKMGSNLYGIGAEYSDDGNILSLKTYWVPGDIELLQNLLSTPDKKYIKRSISMLKKVLPSWKRPRMAGIDLSSFGEVRAKAYFPQKDIAEPLSLAIFYLLLINMGIHTDPDNLVKLAYFLLNNESEIMPGAFIVGLTFAKIQSIKLEIAAKAYFKNTEDALRATSSLALSMGIDPESLYTNISALTKINPFKRPPTIEVICVEFLPKDKKRIIIYCKL